MWTGGWFPTTACPSPPHLRVTRLQGVCFCVFVLFTYLFILYCGVIALLCLIRAGCTSWRGEFRLHQKWKESVAACHHTYGGRGWVHSTGSPALSIAQSQCATAHARHIPHTFATSAPSSAGVWEQSLPLTSFCVTRCSSSASSSITK